MTEFRERYGDWALVAGAAIGLGESFCAALAKQGINLFMIDNREEQLISLSGKLAKEYGIQTIPFCIDLFQTDAVELIMAKISAIEIRLMIYVAAFSQIKKFGNYTTDDLDHYININVVLQIVGSIISEFFNLTERRNINHQPDFNG